MARPFSVPLAHMGHRFKLLPLKVIALLLLTLLVATNAFTNSADTASPVYIDKPLNTSLGHDAYFFPGDDLDWQTVAAQPLSAGEKNSASRLNVGNHGLPLWVRFDLVMGDIDPQVSWLLETFNAFGGDMTLYLVRDGQLLQETSVSSRGVFADRPHPNPIIHFPLKLPPNSEVQLLWHIKSTPSPFYIPTLSTEDSLRDYEDLQLTLVSFAFGFLLSMMVYHLILAAVTQDRAYFYYSLYVGTSGIWLASQTGFLFKYLWPNAPWLEMHVAIISTYLPVMFSTLFAVQFLRLANISKNLTRFYYGVTVLLAVLILVRAFFPFANVDIFSLLVMVTFLSYIFAGVYALRKGVTYARFYLIAWTIDCIAIVNWMFSLVGLPAFLPDYAYWIQIGAFDLQVMLLALALAHRIRSIQRSKIEAEADNKAKSEFLARMSHEVRTPLSGVLGMAELLSDRLEDKTDLHYLNIIRSSGKSLLTIINDILDYSKFASGKLELETIPFNVQQLAVDSLDIFKIQAVEKNIELIADIDLTLPVYLVGDPTRIKQVMLNFISNAIKFTDTGQIILHIHPVEDEEDMVKIAISDSGVGISREDQKNLFKAFSQANKSTTRQYGGTGLGLSICKQLASFMGGQIGIESQPGKGSTFWITAKLPKSDNLDLQKTTSSVNLQNLNLLIVEDNLIFAELLAAQATTWGMTCSIAQNGQAALATIREKYSQGIEFDLISLDLIMPIMDGLETSRRIQADDRFCQIPRLLLTSATNFPPPETLVKAGIRKVIEKPTLPSDLKQSYMQLLSKHSGQNDTVLLETDRKTKTNLPQLAILVAEDNSVNQMVIKGILKRLGQSVTIVSNGEIAVEKVTNDNEHFDLVLMDCDMPVMDGITATRNIRAWESKNEKNPLKIVALTAHALQSQIDDCYAAGMNNYLAKPIDLEKLEELLLSVPANSVSI